MKLFAFAILVLLLATDAYAVCLQPSSYTSCTQCTDYHSNLDVCQWCPGQSGRMFGGTCQSATTYCAYGVVVAPGGCHDDVDATGLAIGIIVVIVIGIVACICVCVGVCICMRNQNQGTAIVCQNQPQGAIPCRVLRLPGDNAGTRRDIEEPRAL